MYNRSNVIRVAILAATLAAGPALAGTKAATSPADQQFSKLSKDGMKANQDIGVARVAIFDGDPALAKKAIGDAQRELARAKGDDAVFMKDESEMKMPGGKQATGAADASETGASAGKTAWIPVDASMTLDEDYAANPAKAKSVAAANGQIKKGDHASAMETLRLADVGVSLVVEVLPLQRSIDGVDKAMQLVEQGKYYEANQALKTVQDGARFDDETATDKTANDKTGAKK